MVAHAFEVVQIIGHRVGEVHEDVEIHGALQGLEDVHVEAHLLPSPQPHEHALGGHLGPLQARVDADVLQGESSVRGWTPAPGRVKRGDGQEGKSKGWDRQEGADFEQTLHKKKKKKGLDLAFSLREIL